MKSQDTKEQAAQFTRVALPLMTKHGVPTTPVNYAIWYEYAAGRNQALREEVDAALQNGQEFSPEFSDELFRRHLLSEDEAQLLEMRDQVRRILSDVLGNLADAGSEAERHGKALEDQAGKLHADLSPEEIKKIVQELSKEAQSMRHSGKELEQRLQAAHSEVENLRKELEQAKQEATTDALTGVANRKCFDATLAEWAQEAQQNGRDLCLVLADIDHFKKFNDTHGHLVGDKVLQFVAATVKECVKGRDLVARYGGEEFAVVLPETPLAGAMKVADNIRATLEGKRLKKKDTGESLGAITISLGVARYRPGEDLDALIKRADAALYRSKENGRNRVTGEDAG